MGVSGWNLAGRVSLWHQPLGIGARTQVAAVLAAGPRSGAEIS